MVCVNSVRVTPDHITLSPGSWFYHAAAEICPCDATNQCVTWHSNNTNVATVNASNGYIYAKAAGTANIYATATDGSGCSDYLTVTVSNTIPVECITLNSGNVSVERGNCYFLFATVCPENATNKTLCWNSSNPNVATVCDGVVSAVANGVANITASATDGSGKSATCRVTVTGNTLVSSITVSPSYKTLTKGSSTFLYVSVSPANATNKCVTWSSSNTNVATVIPTSGLVTAQNAGSAYIYATAQDGSGVVGSCILTVPTPVPVTGITVSPKLKTLGENETAHLYATVCPCNATNKAVIWSSSDTSVATVCPCSGWVTPVFSGSPSEEQIRTVTITATTVDGEFEDSCTVTVDSRGKVTIQKQGNFFNMTFPSGRVWKSVGCDLEDENNRTGYPIEGPDSQYLNDYERQMKSNLQNIANYDIQELAFIYRFDPYGLVYIMKYGLEARFNNNLVGKLLFKDSVYNAIFGEPVRGRFFFTYQNGEVYYGEYLGCNRTDVFSNAEILFGNHPIYNWNSFWESIVRSALITLFNNIPGLNMISNIINAYRLLFFSKSVSQTFLDTVSLIYSIGNIDPTGLSSLFSWTYDLLTNLSFENIIISNVSDLQIYDKIQEQTMYRVVYKANGVSLSMEEVIALCSNGN